MAPRALGTADVTGASCDNVVWGCFSRSSFVTSSILNEKKKPLYLSRGWVFLIIVMAVVLFLNTSRLVLIVVLV